MSHRLVPTAVELAVAAALLWPLPAWAQNTRTVQGVVRDSASGETLPYAQVTTPRRALRATANREGHFVLVGAPADSFTLRVRLLGYQAKDMVVPTGTGPERLSVRLVAVPLELDPLTVSAQEDDHTIQVVEDAVSQVSVTPQNLSALPGIAGPDIFRSVQLLPGISGTNETSSGLYVRGGTPDQTLVLLDGMTVYHVDHFFGFFSAFNADAIKDVQVFTGGFSAQYGGRVSGVVDLTGRTGDLYRPRLDVGANLLSAAVTAQLPLFGRGSLLVSARRSYTDILQTGLYRGIYSTLTGESSSSGLPSGPAQGGGPPAGLGQGRGPFANAQTTSTVPSFYYYDLNVKGTFNASDRDVMSLSLYAGHDYLDRSNAQTRALALGNLGLRTMSSAVTDLTDWGNRGGSLRWARQWHARFLSSALVSFSEYVSDYDLRSHSEQRATDTDSLLLDLTTGNAEANAVRDFTVRLDNEWQVGGAHAVRVGGLVTRSSVRYSMVRDDSLTILDRAQRGSRADLYLEEHWRVRPGLSVTLGARGSRYDRTGHTYVEPRLAASWAVSSHLSLKGAYGRYHQFVNQVVRENVTQGSRDFWLLADTSLVPVQSSTHYIAGVSYDAHDNLFSVEAYHKDLDGLAEFSLRYQPRGAQIDNLFFTGTGAANGVEVLAQRKFGRYTGWVSYTLSRVEHTFPGLNGGRPFPALHDQTHELKAVGIANLGRWNLSATWTFGSGKPYTAPESEYSVTLLDGSQQSYIHVGEKNGLRLPAYHRLDLAAQYRFHFGPWDGDVGLSVFNAYNRANVWYRQFDLSSTPALVTDVRYLGFTPNISVQLHY